VVEPGIIKEDTMENTILTKTDDRSKAKERAGVEAEVSRGTMYAIGVTAAIIGLWGIACFIGGLVSSGGPFSLLKGWALAVTGI